MRVWERVDGDRQLLSAIPFAEWENPHFASSTPGRIAAQYCALLHECYPLPTDAEVGDKVVLPLTHMEDVGGTHAVRAFQAQGQAGGGLAIRAGFCGLVVIRFTPQFVKPGFCRFKRREMFQRTAVFCVVRP